MKKYKQATVFILLLLGLLLTACTKSNNNVASYDTETEEIDVTDNIGIESENEIFDDDYKDNQDDKYFFRLEDVPEYKGSPYAEINNNMPLFTDEEKSSVEPFENYSALDNLGRCGPAYANICVELQPTEERGAIGQIKPSGWHTVKYNDLIEGNYLYNRCHLIGYQLAGENANEENLITGTRYLNVIGMLPFENLVDEYVERTGNHVLYRVTPVFEARNLLANGVEMEAWSVEDAGLGICFHVFCYNVQPGIEIDYSTGDSWRIEDNFESDTISDSPKPLLEEQLYILNTNTKKIHLPSYSSVNDIKEKNKKQVTCSYEELINQGYSGCKRCIDL